MALILLIEDESGIRENCKELLNLRGYKCVAAANGFEGVELANTTHPDIIFCDIFLPGLDGFQVKYSLNEAKETASIPFVYLTGKSDRTDLRHAMDIGAADFITKPFKIKELYDTIERILGNKKSLEESINQKVSDALSDFVHVARHECNTPLHGIINLSQVLQPDSDPETFKLIIDSIQTSGKRLHKTLNNLIDLMRLTHYSESYMQKFDEFALLKKLRNKTLLFEKKYQLKINLQEDCSEKWLSNYLEGDIALLFNELIDNACKFSAQKQIVEIMVSKTCSDDSSSVRVDFSNQAEVGTQKFSVDDIAPFKQFNREKTEHQGSGLGLQLVKLICNKYRIALSIQHTDTAIVQVSVNIPLTRSLV